MSLPSFPPAPEPVAAVVPVKAFGQAKGRLTDTLNPATRAELARAMAVRVLLAARPLPTFVVCDDDEVRAWAERHGAEVIWTPRLGLNGAVKAALAQLAGAGFRQALVSHADLPLATDLVWLTAFDGVTLVPDRRRDGTNVAVVPTDAGFEFAYGAGSFAAHREEARRLGLATRLVTDERLSWDVDTPDDLVIPGHLAFPAEVAALVPAARDDSLPSEVP